MSAKIFLRRLNDMSTFSLLQTKLSCLNDTYLSNSFDSNVSRCIDIIELNARVQREMFKLLNLVSAEGGVYGGASAIRARLLPCLNHEAAYLNGLLSSTGTELYPSAWWRYPHVHLRTDVEFQALADEYERNLNALELDLSSANVDNARLEAELEQTRAELIDERFKATDDKICNEAELSNLRTRLRDAEFRLSLERYKPYSLAVVDCEREIRRLREDIESAQRRSRARSLSPVPRCVRRRSVSPVCSVSRVRSISPVCSASRIRSISPVCSLSPARSLLLLPTSERCCHKVREDTLIQRFNDLYLRERHDAMNLLRTVSCDHEMNQRICFSVVQEAFAVSKRHLIDWRLRLRSQLVVATTVGQTLESVVQEYIDRNLDYYELSSIVTEVTDNLRLSPRLTLPLGVTYSLVNVYIREACRIAWHMTCLPNPLDIAFASDAEVFDETKYRRSYDSEYSAPLVNHHIWPALMQGARVVVKGEACTRRGASLCRSRATSPCRRECRSPVRSRSISPACRARSISPVLYSCRCPYY